MKILLSNRNPSWGGGELWFFQAAREFAARGHDVTTAVRSGSKLATKLADAGLAKVEERADPFANGIPDITICNSRKKDMRHVLGFKRCPRRGLILRKGIARPIMDGMFGRRQLRRLSHILTNSDATTEVVSNSIPWFPQDRITRIYNPVYLNPITPIPGDGKLRILAVGRLVDHKGFDVLLESVALLRRDWGLTIAGTGRNHDALVKQCQKLGISGKVGFAGHVEDVQPLYAMADVVAISSRYEGFCFVAAEAALAGLPIVSTNADSLLETARGADFVGIEQPEQMAAALEKVEPGLRPDAQAEARALFDPTTTFDALEALLAQVAEEDAVGTSARR